VTFLAVRVSQRTAIKRHKKKVLADMLFCSLSSDQSLRDVEQDRSEQGSETPRYRVSRMQQEAEQATGDPGARHSGPMRIFGTLLYEWLFQGELPESMRQAREVIQTSHPPRGLRFQIGFDPALIGLTGFAGSACTKKHPASF
jgi:hypothetical protein